MVLILLNVVADGENACMAYARTHSQLLKLNFPVYLENGIVPSESFGDEALCMPFMMPNSVTNGSKALNHTHLLLNNFDNVY